MLGYYAGTSYAALPQQLQQTHTRPEFEDVSAYMVNSQVLIEGISSPMPIKSAAREDPAEDDCHRIQHLWSKSSQQHGRGAVTFKT